MTQKIDFTIPFNNLGQYVPINLRNTVVEGLTSNLFDRFMTNDESIPLYGYVGRKPNSPDDRAPKIPQADVERDINAIIPVFNFKRGSEYFAFTVEDILNKAKVLGVTASQSKWLYTKANNYVPPIDIDKFANYYNYFWVAKSLPSVPTMEWNLELLPEYYTIAKPKDSDLDKLNAIAATTEAVVRTGSGFYDQVFKLKFVNNQDFTIVAQNTLGAYSTLPSPPKTVSGTLSSFSGDLSGNGTLNIPANATLVTLTGSGGTGTAVHNPGQPAIIGTPIFSTNEAVDWVITNFVSLGVSNVNYGLDFGKPAGLPAIGDTATSNVSFPDGLGQFASYEVTWGYGTYFPIIGYTPSQPYIAPFDTITVGDSTTATLDGNTETWIGGAGAIAGATLIKSLTSDGTGQTLTFSIGSGGTLSYEYVVVVSNDPNLEVSNNTLKIPIGVVSVSLTGAGGVGYSTSSPGSPAVPPQPIYGNVLTLSWQSLGTIGNPAYTLVPQFPVQSGVTPPTTPPTALNQTEITHHSTIISDGSVWDGYYNNVSTNWGVTGTYPIIGYTPGSPAVPPSIINVNGPNTMASLNGNTITWVGGNGPVAGTPSTHQLTSDGTGQDLTFSIGKGGSFAFTYNILDDFAPGTGYAYSLSTAVGSTAIEDNYTFVVTGPQGLFTLLTFTIRRDPIFDSNGIFVGFEEFAPADTFMIDTAFLSFNYTITFAGAPGLKGKIKNVNVLREYQTIDGVKLKEGQRVLVKNNSAEENGIYTVSPHGWTRASDYDGVNIAPGAKIWIVEGIVNGGKLFTSDINRLWSGVFAPSNTNDWQEGNFWVHVNDLSTLSLSRADATQAVRPIIEYSNYVQLNAFSVNGVPSDNGGMAFKQEKTEFNQLPMFDLFRYDGTHSNLVSSIFYYVEDLTAEVDLDLQKRIKLDIGGSRDAVFNHGLVDLNGDMLFYKLAGELKSIWHNGYSEATAVDQTFIGTSKGKVSSLNLTSIAVPRTWTFTATSPGSFSVSRTLTVGVGTETLSNPLIVGVKYIVDELEILITAGTVLFAVGENFVFDVIAGPVASAITFNGAVKGTITAIVPSFYSQQQVWTLKALTATSFSIVGSKNQILPVGLDTVTVGVPYTNSELSCTILAGTLPFNEGDEFLVRIGNIEMPRYVYRNSDDGIFDLYGGEAADINNVGAYQVSRSFIHNPYNESRDEVLEGTLFSHFRGILQNQFSGTQNNYAFGGAIKNWSEQHTLLASLLMQRDLTPISVIDLAKNEYEVGINTIADIYKQNIVQYIATNGVVDPNDTIDQNQKLEALLNDILQKRTLDNDVRTVIFDTTAGVLGFPATLPQLGIVDAKVPYIGFDNVLGYNVLFHHDGHSSVLAIDTIDFRRQVLNNSADITVVRSDGTTTPAVGSFTTTPPIRPYKGELWIMPYGAESLMFAFDVDSDLDAPISLSIGTSWYRRDTGILVEWDGSAWINQPTIMLKWRLIDLADTLNQLILLVENKLFNHINPNARKVDFISLQSDLAFSDQMKRELFTFAANNNLSPLGSDYTPADAFTWNYSNANVANVAPVNTPTVPARWYNVLLEHHKTFLNVIPTERPNLEPWKLLGFTELAPWWSTLTPIQQQAFSPYAQPSELQYFTNGGYVKVAKTTFGATPLNGLQVIDGVSLISGDLVLLQNEIGPENNGIWIVSSGLWTRSTLELTQDTFVQVESGAVNFNTAWALSNNVVTINVDPVLFKQVRYWTDALWAYIKSMRPGLTLSVDTTRDGLLPPYFSPTLLQSVNALTTVVPSNIASTYQFGEGSPVETVWKSSIEYGYSLARALFRHDPLQFLGFCWGFNWVEVDNILYDAYDINTPGHKRFRLHGDQNRIVDRGTSNITLAGVSGLQNIDLSITFDAYEVNGANRYQNFSIRNNKTGINIGYVREGTPIIDINYLSIIYVNGIAIEDRGLPFHIGDKFTVTANADGSNLLVTFTAAVNYSYLGFGQIFTNALRSSSVDTNDSFSIEAFRGWDVNMGYRAGGLVATDDLDIKTDSASLSASSFNLIFKKNSIAKDMWIQGLRITVTNFGNSTVNNDGVYIPKSDGSDWIFFIEGYNPRYSNIEYYNLNLLGDFVTFNILDQRHTSTVWKTFTDNVSVTSSYLPLTITGIQNVINFLYGYSRYLEDQGWEFNKLTTNNIDAETGRSRTWQLEFEKFVDSCYTGMQIGRGHIVNPFMDQLWVRQDTGLLSNFIDTSLFDITGHPGVFDIAGIKMPINDLMVTRGNEVSQFTAEAPIYSAHAQIDNFEHLFIFNYYVEDSLKSGLLYNPFSGARVITYKFNGRRSAAGSFRPEFGGHYLLGGSGNSQVKQNLQASTNNVANFYDTNSVFQNDLTSRHALSLLGFSTKSYFSDLDISKKSQFNFWRGLIQSKGTNMSVDAYLNNDRFEDAKIDEYWAYKVAEYGDARQKTFPELKVTVDDSVQQFTQFQFDATETNGILADYTQISRLDESRWFSLEDLDQDAYFKAEAVGTYSRSNFTQAEVDKIPFVINLPFIADKLVISGSADVTKINATTLLVNSVTLASTLLVVGYGPATPRYNPIKLFNYVADELVEEIPLWHPAFGQHTPAALESINIISTQNPAKYSFSTQVVNNNSYDPLRPWGNNEIGRVWFDTRNLKYIPYYDEVIFPNRASRLNRWGSLADFATVDVYEWVKSSVPPSEYNALALKEAGNGDLDPSTKAAGEVALQETYVRDRRWFLRPVAWSYSTVPASNTFDWAGSPPFTASYNSKLYFESNGRVSLDVGTFASFNITAGMRIGTWDPTPSNSKPTSEYLVNNEFSKIIIDGTQEFTTIHQPQDPGFYPACTVDLKFNKYTSAIGTLTFTAEPLVVVTTTVDDNGTLITTDDYIVQLTVSDDSGISETVVVNHGPAALPNATINITTGDSVVVVLESLGLTISVISTSGSGVYEITAWQKAIIAALEIDILLRDTVSVTPIIPWDSGNYGNSYVVSNDENDQEYTDNAGLGWRAWSVPTQAQLDADGKQPVSSWRPYLGDLIEIQDMSLTQIQEAVAYSNSPLTLNDGVVINRTDTKWTEWKLLKDETIIYTQLSNVVSDILLSHTEIIDSTKTSVYVNGITLLSASYSIVGKDITILNVMPGSEVRVKIRHYEPSAEELTFDPEVADDLGHQQQYKQDYEYVALPVRDSEGALSSTLYYFWVKNKSIAANGKKLSVQSIARELVNGPANYITLQHLIGSGVNTDVLRYDAISISGLSYVVAKDNTFKLRFTRNFTLRDDPENIELKDTHTEWALMRPNQTTRIPEALWNKMVDSAVGSDVVGNAIPEIRRVLYDERNGTSIKYGFGKGQSLAPKDLLTSSISYTIVNTKLVNKNVPKNSAGVYPVDFIEFLNFDQSDSWFATPESTRQTLTDIWTNAKVTQINEIFFAALNDMLSCNYEVSDIFKTSRLSAYSIKIVDTISAKPVYE